MDWERVNPINLNLNTSGLRSLKTSGHAGYNPSGSMAIDPISAGIAGASVIGNLIGGFQSKKMQKRALKQQQEQFKEQMAFNEAWNQKNFDNENKWRQYDYDWNTMSAQRQRIEDAGMNPALMMGQMSPGFSSSQSAGTGNMSAPNAQTPIVADALGQSFSRLAGDVGSVLQSFASAGKMDMETKEIRDTLYQKVRGYMLENDQRELALTLDRMYAATERYQGIRQQVADYAKTVAEKVAAYAQGRYFDESALNQMEQSMLTAAKRKMSEEEYRQFVELFPIVKQREQEAVKLIQQQQKTEQSKQSANYASAEDSRSSAALNRERVKTEQENQYSVRELAKKTKAERMRIIENSLSLYLSEYSDDVRMDKELKAAAPVLLERKLEAEIRSYESGANKNDNDVLFKPLDVLSGYLPKK